MWLILVIVIGVGLVFSGCAQQAPAPKPAPAPTPSPAPTVGAPIKLAVLGPMKIPQIGGSTWAGAKMAADEINAAGGIKVGNTIRKLELIKVDDNELVNIQDATLAMDRAITVDKADIVLGGIKSDVVMSLMDVASDYKKVLMGAGASIPQLTQKIADDYQKYKYFFRVNGSLPVVQDPTDTKIDCEIIPKILRDAGIEPKVVLVGEKSLVVDATFAAHKKGFEAAKIPIVGEWRPSIAATDMSAEAIAIESTGATIIVRTGSGTWPIPFSKEYGGRKMKAVVCGSSNLVASKSHWDATSSLCNYEATSSGIGYGNLTPKTIPFWDKFEKETGGWPDLFSVWSYDGIYTLKEGIEKAGSIETEQLIKGLEAVDYKGVQGRIRFDKKHDVADVAPDYVGWCGLQWQNGKLIPFYPQAAPFILPPWMKK